MGQKKKLLIHVFWGFVDVLLYDFYYFFVEIMKQCVIDMLLLNLAFIYFCVDYIKTHPIQNTLEMFEYVRNV